MAMPYANTVIGVLKAALRLVESCSHIPRAVRRCENLREAVYEVTAELEVVARKEPRSELVAHAGENFCQKTR